MTYEISSSNEHKIYLIKMQVYFKVFISIMTRVRITYGLS